MDALVWGHLVRFSPNSVVNTCGSYGNGKGRGLDRRLRTGFVVNIVLYGSSTSSMFIFRSNSCAFGLAAMGVKGVLHCNSRSFRLFNFFDVHFYSVHFGSLGRGKVLRGRHSISVHGHGSFRGRCSTLYPSTSKAVRCTFSFCWLNPLAGFARSIARNCSETHILSSRNCSAHCTGRFKNANTRKHKRKNTQTHTHTHSHTNTHTTKTQTQKHKPTNTKTHKRKTTNTKTQTHKTQTQRHKHKNKKTKTQTHKHKPTKTQT